MKAAKKKSAKKKSPAKQSARTRETVQRAGKLVARAANRRGEIPQAKEKDRGWYVRELERLRWKEKVYGANGFRERLDGLYNAGFPAEDIQIVICHRHSGQAIHEDRGPHRLDSGRRGA